MQISHTTFQQLFDAALNGTLPGRLRAWNRAARTWTDITKQQLVSDALRTASALAAQELQPSTRVLIAERQPIDILRAYLAVIAAGATPAIASFRPAFDNPQAQRQRLDSQLAVLGDRAKLIVAQGISAADHRAERALDASIRGALEAPRPTANITHLQFSSGSTGTPKAIALSAQAVSHNLRAIVEGIRLRDSDVTVSWLPLYHDMGLIFGALLPLFAGIDGCLLSPYDYLRDPLDWMRAANATAGTISAAPDYAYADLGRRLETCAPLDLSNWRVLLSGSEPVHASTMRAMAAAGRRHQLDPAALTVGYGMAETVLYVTSSSGEATRALLPRSDLSAAGPVEVLDHDSVNRTKAPSDRFVELMACGPIRDVKTAIVDPTTHETLPERHIGEIVVSGDSVADHYLHENGELQDLAGTHRTGDLGFLHDGQLFIVDRLKNIVIHNGENHSCAQLEAQLAGLARLDANDIVIFDADLTRPGSGCVACVETGGDSGTLADLAWQARGQLAVPLAAVCVVKPRSLPRTTSGKKQHHETARRWRDGKLAIRATRTSQPASNPAGPAATAPDEPRPALEHTGASAGDGEVNVLALIAAFAHGRSNGSDITADSHLRDDLDLDSLGVYELILQLETATGTTFDETAVGTVRTVSDLIELAGAAPTQLHGEQERAGCLGRQLDGMFLVAQQQQGRQIQVEGRWLTDFASCNYLGFDLDDTIKAAIAPMMDQWGVHPSWTRAVCSPAPYRQLEEQLAQLVGAEDTVLFPTITLLHSGLLPALARNGTIICDSAVHMSVQEAAALAQATTGATVTKFDHQDLDQLRQRLRQAKRNGPIIIAIDGVYSMHGTLAPLEQINELAHEWDAIIYVDDAHGIGVLGRAPDASQPYGRGGGGIVTHLGLDYERIVYVAGMSKAFSTMGGFVTCSAGVTRTMAARSSTAVFGGPLPVPCLAAGLAGLRVNEESGDAARATLQRLTGRLTTGVRQLGFRGENENNLPIVNVVVGGSSNVREANKILWRKGLLVTPAVFPAAPIDAGGFRFSPTAANTDSDIDLALEAVEEIAATTTGR